MTERRSVDDQGDQDAEPTMTAPPEDRPDAGAATGLSSGGRGDSPDVVDTEDEQDSSETHG
jgi:hypothetical protein